MLTKIKTYNEVKYLLCLLYYEYKYYLYINSLFSILMLSHNRHMYVYICDLPKYIIL